MNITLTELRSLPVPEAVQNKVWDFLENGKPSLESFGYGEAEIDLTYMEQAMFALNEMLGGKGIGAIYHHGTPSGYYVKGLSPTFVYNDYLGEFFIRPNLDAVDFFYPKGFWGGYGRFFDPALPSRIGTGLLSDINAALKGDAEAAERAIATLSQSHVKWGGTEETRHIPTTCHPTADARTAISFLSAITSVVPV